MLSVKLPAVDAVEDARFGPNGEDSNLLAERDRREEYLARLQATRVAPGSRPGP